LRERRNDSVEAVAMTLTWPGVPPGPGH